MSVRILHLADLHLGAAFPSMGEHGPERTRDFLGAYLRAVEFACSTRRPVDLVSGRYALIEKSREFTLVPWRPVLDPHIGKPVSGLMRGDGISWTIGRGRSGPSIS